MFEFIAGIVTGAIIFGGKKESDAEYRGRCAAADRRRAAETLSRDLSDLPRVVEGQVDDVTLDDGRKYAVPLQYLSVGEWIVCLPADVKVSKGSQIRVVANSRVRVDGTWHNLPERVTPLRKQLGSLLAVAAAAGAAAMLWLLWEVLQLGWRAVTSLGQEWNAEAFIYRMIGVAACIALISMASSLPAGKIGIWRREGGE